MADYKKMYSHLFNAITDALKMHHYGDYVDAEYILKKAQIRCEELFDETEPDIKLNNLIPIESGKTKP